MNLSLAPGLLEEMIRHARMCYPIEACGLLAGHGSTATRFIPMENALASPAAYEMDPQQLIRTLRQLRESGEQLAAIFHSHPKGPAEPSRYDIDRAFYAEAAHVIVSLKDPDRPLAQGFRIVEGEATPIELHAIV